MMIVAEITSITLYKMLTPTNVSHTNNFETSVNLDDLKYQNNSQDSGCGEVGRPISLEEVRSCEATLLDKLNTSLGS